MSSTYHNDNKQISPAVIYAEVRVELKSYFDSGAMDDLMFSRWTEEALDQLGVGTYEIKEAYLRLKNNQVKLPTDFIKVRELWSCYTSYSPSIKLPSATYNQYTCRVNPYKDNYDTCNECNDCYPTDYVVTYKTTDEVMFSFKKSHLLQPGNIHCQTKCSDDCMNNNITSPDTFDIRDNKVITNFKNGDLLLIYYGFNEDEEGYRTIPDEHYAKTYVKDYIRFKLFESLFNSTTDESFNQVKYKLEYYENRMNDSRANHSVYSKMNDIYDVKHLILKSYHSLDKFQIRF